MEENKVESVKTGEKPAVKPYIVFGSDFSLSNSDIIDYYKTRMKMMAVKFKLAGKFDDRGDYKISNEIRHDLIGMEKEIDESGESFYKAEALYMKKHFYFTVEITELEEGKAKASLYLSEYVEDYLPGEYIVSHICDYVDVFDDEFRIRVRKAFNLVDVATKVDDLAVPELAVVMQDAFDIEMVVGGLYDMASQIYVMRMIKALEEGGEIGQKVLKKYRQLLGLSKDIEINDKYRYAHYKALLDRAIDEYGGYEAIGLDPKVVAMIILEMNRTVKAINNASSRGIYEINTPKKEEKKQEAKSSSKSGGAKKADKKKDKKDDKKKDKKKSDKKDEKKKGGGISVKVIENLYKRDIVLPEKSTAKVSSKKFDTVENETKQPVLKETKQQKKPTKVVITKKVVEVSAEIDNGNAFSEDDIDDIEDGNTAAKTQVIERIEITETKLPNGDIVREKKRQIIVNGTVDLNNEDNVDKKENDIIDINDLEEEMERE